MKVLSAEIMAGAKEEFVNMCYDAYPIVEDIDLFEDMKDEMPDENINLTLRRVLGTFIDLEEFEKCLKIRDFLKKEFPENTEPVFDYRKFKR